jgi:hypothetical protein
VSFIQPRFVTNYCRDENIFGRILNVKKTALCYVTPYGLVEIDGHLFFVICFFTLLFDADGISSILLRNVGKLPD